MAKVEGLNLRGSRFYVRILIPTDLQATYDGKARVNLALGTGDRREAILRATTLRAQWLTDFEETRRSLNAQAVESIPPELAAVLAERVGAAVLAGDEALRADLPTLAAVVRETQARIQAHTRATSRLTIPGAPATPVGIAPLAPDGNPDRDPLAGTTEEERRWLAGLNAHMDGTAAIALAGGNLAVVLPLAQAEARKLGLTFDARTPGAREALAACLKAYRTARRGATQRDAGEVVETPAVRSPSTAGCPSTTASCAGTGTVRTIRAVFDRWRQSGAAPRSGDSVAAYGRAVAQFEGQHPALPLDAFTGDLGDSYRAWLLANCRTPKTARDRLTALKSLLKYAAERLEWMPRQPWRGLDIKAPTTDKRRPWTVEELKALFHTPLFQAGALPESPNGGREAAYWLPLLGIYTGARLGELCQLRLTDVQEVEGIPVLVLTDEGEGQRIKSEAGRRSVPIHSELQRLGFLDFVAATRVGASGGAPDGPLWPSLKVREGKPSDYFGRWFREFRRAQGLTDTRPDFHCFRHTVRPLMRRAGISEETQDKVTGHRARGSIGTVVYGHWTLREVQAAVEAIQYPELGALPVVLAQLAVGLHTDTGAHNNLALHNSQL
ncbi:tyrosine-type recombinase/integrase [Comamonas faecalis]|uniref:Tyrosine-type recombinase/integrase n=1 Tax=Comamonas faecalis TaxID=1387849 RepID=A0ABP7RZ98_9BURK